MFFLDDFNWDLSDNSYMKFRSKLSLIGEKGQTMVEYTLMLVVIVSIMFSVFDKLEDYLINNPDSMQKKYLNQFQSTFAGQNGSFEGQYRYFRIPR
jgi:hypothetical protein